VHHQEDHSKSKVASEASVSAGPAHEAVPLSLRQESESEALHPVGVRTASESKEQDLCRTNFKADADSVKALAASAGWLQGIDHSRVTQPGPMAQDMPKKKPKRKETPDKMKEGKLLRIVHSALSNSLQAD